MRRTIVELETHVVWTYDFQDGWYTEGAPQTEQEAVGDVKALKALGIRAVALKVGKEPEQLHPAERPICVVA
jgi:hypothetical protein